jgi:hypothetical protein
MVGTLTHFAQELRDARDQTNASQLLSSEPDLRMPKKSRIPMTSAYGFTSSTFSSAWART